MVNSKRLKSQVVSKGEFDRLLAKLPRDLATIPGTYEIFDKKLNGKILQDFNIPVRMFRVLLILLWLYGRRIEELLLFQRKDVRWDSDYLTIEFYALKRKDTMKRKRAKPIPRSNPYVQEVIAYAESMADGEMIFFPGESRGGRVKMVTIRDKETGQIKIGKKGRMSGKPLIYEYKFKLPAGTMSVERAWKCLKYLAPDLWLHFFRSTNATFIAEKTKDPFKIRDWLDWTTISPASSYVSESEARAREVGDLRGFE